MNIIHKGLQLKHLLLTVADHKSVVDIPSSAVGIASQSDLSDLTSVALHARYIPSEPPEEERAKLVGFFSVLVFNFLLVSTVSIVVK